MKIGIFSQLLKLIVDLNISEDISPRLPRRLFGEFRYDEMDWRNDYLTVMARALERGNNEEWEEIIRFYGHDQVVHAVKHEIKFLADYAIEEDMLCYKRKQSRSGHWL